MTDYVIEYALYATEIIVIIYTSIFFALAFLGNTLDILSLTQPTIATIIIMLLFSAPFLISTLITYRKNFNLFTQQYASLTSNIIFFFGESILCLAFHLIFLFSITLPIASSNNFTTTLMFIVGAGFVSILLWSAVESNFFYKRPDISIRHRANALTVIDFISKNFTLSKVESTSEADQFEKIATLVPIEGMRAEKAEGFDNISTLLNDAEKLDVELVSLRGSGVRGAKYALRYHELYGRTSFIGLFIRIIITPLVASGIAAVGASIVRYNLGDFSSPIEGIISFYTQISDALNGFLVFFIWSCCSFGSSSIR